AVGFRCVAQPIFRVMLQSKIEGLFDRELHNCGYWEVVGTKVTTSSRYLISSGLLGLPYADGFSPSDLFLGIATMAYMKLVRVS
ncbi:MAG: hypothetical protein VCB07_09585, partial [Gammaproteobacteria bacterium]